MKAKFISGPLHGQEIEVGDNPPERWIAPTVPVGRDGHEPPFRPVVGKWNDPSAPRRLDLHEYERNGSGDYVCKTLHRADGTKL